MISQLTPPGECATIDDVRAVSDPSPSIPTGLTDLVDRARRQDPAAFRELFQTHVRAVHRICTRIYGPSADVEDIVQTSFVEAFRSLSDFRGDALFSTWLTRIAVRVALRAARQRPAPTISLDQALERAGEGPGPSCQTRTTSARAHVSRFAALYTSLARLKRRNTL